MKHGGAWLLWLVPLELRHHGGQGSGSGGGPELAAAAIPEPLEHVQAGAVPAAECQLRAGVTGRDWVLPASF